MIQQRVATALFLAGISIALPAFGSNPTVHAPQRAASHPSIAQQSGSLSPQTERFREVPIAIKDGGFEGVLRENWRLSQHAGVLAYRFNLDTDVVFEGKQSLRVEQIAPQVFALISQSLSDLPLGRYALSGAVRIVGGSNEGLQLLVRRNLRFANDFDNTLSDPLPSSASWTPVRVEFDVTPDVASISFGPYFRGGGTAWIDAVRLVRLEPN